MPLTQNGTAYTTTTIDLGSPHGVMHITTPDAVTPSTPVRALLYAHGAGGASDQFATLSSWAPFLHALMDDTTHPWIIVEGSGGAVLGAQNWGNPAAAAAYPA